MSLASVFAVLFTMLVVTSVSGNPEPGDNFMEKAVAQLIQMNSDEVMIEGNPSIEVFEGLFTMLTGATIHPKDPAIYNLYFDEGNTSYTFSLEILEKGVRELRVRTTERTSSGDTLFRSSIYKHPGSSKSGQGSSDDSYTDNPTTEGYTTENPTTEESITEGSSTENPYSYSSCSSEMTTYCPLGEDNTMCQYCGVDSTNCGSEVITREITEEDEKAAIVDKHNELRRKVAKGEEIQGTTGSQPSASNMNELVWDDEVAKMAQTWADQCSSNPHDPNRKMVDGSSLGVYCGQNSYSSWSSSGPSSTKRLIEPVQAWYNEVKDFDKSAVEKFFSRGGNHTDVVGHYTQVVWGDVSRVGCGYVHRIDPDQKNYKYRETIICNYCKGGNMLDSAMYNIGDPASNCPQDHPNANDGLCTK